MQRLITKWGPKKVRLATFIVSGGLTIWFVLTLYLSIKFYLDLQKITIITM
ncbi:hypothetical protein [Latilactobacillus curvatus]|uniref:hypothetical protein n=1 Tax=Latilactobacillus curvatus TaxID=28038 RepID=UPI0012FDDAA4|nr:hypothetical protein [Latilactobacillus curvatus]